MELEEFREMFLKEDIAAESQASNRYQAEVFLDEAVDILKNDYGFAADMEPCFDDWNGGTGNRRFHKMHVDAAHLDLSSNVLHLMLVDLNTGPVKNLTKELATEKVQLLINFFENCVKGYYDEGEITNPTVALARDIKRNVDKLCKVHFYVASTDRLGSTVKTLALGKHRIKDLDIEYELDILDITKIFRAKQAGFTKDEIVIKCSDHGIDGIPCIRAEIETDQYESYLAIVPGSFLASIYMKYNGAILESNVRSFLKFNGAVNKGIRKTILTEKARFFTYNNGISTTARDIVVETLRGKGPCITSFTDLQIINGGQTTATLAATLIAAKGDPQLLKGIYVQMKLTVIRKSDPELIRNIATFANKQNAVKDADLNSGHPFYVRMKDFSDKTYAPVAGIVQPIWFFERARGEYDQPMMQMTPAQRAKYKAVRPTQKRFRLVDLAKYLNVADLEPQSAAWGGEVSAREFHKRMDAQWKRDDRVFDRVFYKELIGKKILFDHIGTIISDTDWYKANGAYRPQLIEYTFSRLVLAAQEAGGMIDFLRIWNDQAVPPAFDAAIRTISKIVFDVFYDENRSTANIETYAKKDECWNIVKHQACTLPRGVKALLIDERTHTAQHSREAASSSEGPHDETSIVEEGADVWTRLRTRGLKEGVLSDVDASILETAAAFALGDPVSLTRRQVEHAFQLKKDLADLLA